MEAQSAAERTVRMLLAREELTPSEEEIAGMVKMYPQMRANVAKLYFDDVRYDQPALIYAARE